MFTIKLFKFNKKVNSTDVPVMSTGTNFNCLMKTPSSLITPVIEIEYNPDNLPKYNYAYIESFERYYFINNIVFERGVWILSLSVDLLASYKEDIFNSRQYVIRSASRKNEFLIDTFYNTYRSGTVDDFYKSNYVSTVQHYNPKEDEWVNINYYNVNFKNGVFVVGVVGDNEAGVVYYVMSTPTFKEFIGKAFNLVPTNMTDVSSGVANAIFNPLQYITSVRWYPKQPYYTGTSTNVVKIGGQTITMVRFDCWPLDTLSVEEFRFDVALPNHPQANTIGKYLNMPPYTECNLYFQPFGNIPIDMTKTLGSNYIRVKWYVDYCTGASTVEIRNNTLGDGNIIYSDNAEFGVPLPISSLIYDWKGALILGGANWLKNTITKSANSFSQSNDKLLATAQSMGLTNIEDVSTGVVGGSIPSVSEALSNINTNLLDTVVNMAGASLGQLNTKGAQGSFLAYNLDLPYVYAWFSKLTGVDNDKYGSPLYENVRLDSLSGFCICSNASVSYESGKTPLESEKAGVNTLLNNGIFIE